MDYKEHLILYVDDEATNRLVFEQSFTKKFRIKVVDSGKAALEVLEKEPVAVLVTDQRMPEMSGDELLTQYKARSPETTRIVVTAYSDIDPILRAVNDGLVVRYIVKPWDRTELEGVLRWAVEAHALAHQSSALHLRLVEAERLMTLGQFSAHVFHELSNWVGALSQNMELLESTVPLVPDVLSAAADGKTTELDDDDRRLLREYAAWLPDIAREARASMTFMTNLLRLMRQFQKKEKPVAESRDADPRDAIAMAIAVCRHGSIGTGSRLEYDGPSELPRVCATATELLQILMNLVRNAQQAFERDATRTARVGRGVFIHAAEQGGHVRFVVRDTGPGMPPEVLAKIGTPFFTTRSEGTGLGVAQCKRLVGSLGGRLDIESTPGRGTTVTFTVPKVG